MKKYKMPAKANLKGRSSTISNAYAISITPYIYPDEEAVLQSYSDLQIEEGQCAYCLGEGTGKDHLKPLVRNGMPTGYITSIENLVPCCSACNSAKGSKEFQDWYLSENNVKRLKAKGLSDEMIKSRFDIISKYEKKIECPLDYEKIVGKDLWNEYKERRKNFIKQLDEEQAFCNKLERLIRESLEK